MFNMTTSMLRVATEVAKLSGPNSWVVAGGVLGFFVLATASACVANIYYRQCGQSGVVSKVPAAVLIDTPPKVDDVESDAEQSFG